MGERKMKKYYRKKKKDKKGIYKRIIKLKKGIKTKE